MDDQLASRLRRLYAALDTVIEKDVSLVRGSVTETDSRLSIMNDFRSQLSNEQLENFAFGLIHSIAHLRDHMRARARLGGKDPDSVDEFIRSHESLMLVIDLSNWEKHGPNRRGGWSGRNPELRNINRVLRITSGNPSGGIGFTLSANGAPVVFGGGSAAVVITGDIVNASGERVGDLEEVARQAVLCSEELMDSWGIHPRNGQWQ